MAARKFTVFTGMILLLASAAVTAALVIATALLTTL
jgi:hypothetical protein